MNAKSFAALKQRPMTDRSKESKLQNLLLAVVPCTTYFFSPFLTALFLWDSSSEQFIFSILPVTVQKIIVLKLFAAAYEFHLVLMWMAVAHFGLFHCVTFLRVIQRSLKSVVAELE